MLGFLRWMFTDAHKNAQLWAVGISIVALVAQLSGCPAPYPWYTSLVAIAISLSDLFAGLISYQYDLYKLEQRSIVRELSKHE